MTNRPKASDVFDNSKSPLATPATFSDIFPTIEKLKIDVTEANTDSGNPRNHTFNQHRYQHFVNCSNKLCFGGGADLQSIISEMVKEGKAKDQFFKSCIGKESSKSGKVIYRTCSNTFTIDVEITYNS